jgi:hypothetical protein
VIIAPFDSRDLDGSSLSHLSRPRSFGKGNIGTSFGMAAPNGAFTTGKDDGDVRRRNVQNYEKANGGTVYKMEAEDTKKIQKVSSLEPVAAGELSSAADSAIAAFRPHCLSRRMGVCDGTPDLHGACFLHADVADRAITYRHLG